MSNIERVEKLLFCHSSWLKEVAGTHCEEIGSIFAMLFCWQCAFNVFMPFLIQSYVPCFYSARNARIASAVLATAIPSVRPSQAGIVLKRRHVARCSLHHWIAKSV